MTVDRANRCILQMMVRKFGVRALRAAIDEIAPPQIVADLQSNASEPIYREQERRNE